MREDFQKSVSTKIKVDFNLLMSGTWVLEKKGNQRIHYFEKSVGNGKIIIYNAIDIPTTLDSKVLDYLMKISQENDWSQEIIIPSITQIVRDLGLGKRKQTVERIKNSLKILKNTHIEFHNCFIDTGVLDYFENGNWELISIGIVAKYGFKAVKGRGNPIQVKVIFDNDFISLCKYSLGYKLIPYAPINGLRDTTYALYKWAWRWFNAEKGYGERWIGNGKKLVEWYKNELNSTANYKYPSKILERVNSAIKQLNKNKKVPFCIRIKEENGNYKIEIYRKEEVTLKREIPFDTLPSPVRKAIIKLIETKKKKIKSPYAYARSMSWKELEAYLNKLLVLDITEGWDFIKQVLEWGNEFETFVSETLTLEEREDGKYALIIFEKSRLNKGYLATFFKAFPNLKTFLYTATDWVRGEKALQGAKT